MHSFLQRTIVYLMSMGLLKRYKGRLLQGRRGVETVKNYCPKVS